MSEKTFRAWCLSWEDDEETGMDVVGYDPISQSWKTDTRTTLYVPFREYVLDAEEVAEHYADYCHSHRDGWESSWPLMFRVRCPDGTTIDFEVDRETVPQFSATEVKQKAVPHA